jgi:hypothetical protein
MLASAKVSIIIIILLATEGQSISKSSCRAPSEGHGQIFITLWELRSFSRRALYLTRRWIRLLCMLLALASVVLLGSESLRTREHILRSQIWDFPFRHLLLLAGSRWRCSNPPPHGWSRSRSSLPATSRHAQSWHWATLGPMAIYLFNVKSFIFFFHSLILLFDKGGGWSFFYM